jgi:glycyl-tRNA synthetase beta chain
MTVAPLLVELHTEELPPKALRQLGSAFAESIAEALRTRGLAPSSGHRAFATPRRLAVLVDEVLEHASDRDVELKGPSVKVGLDAEGRPTQALVKWAERQNVSLDSLERRGEGKNECFYAIARLPGDRLADAIQGILEQALDRLPIPKVMQYQLADGRTTVSFVRPAHRLVVLHGDRVLPAGLLGLESGRETFGHRFLSSGPVSIPDASSYESRLESARGARGPGRRAHPSATRPTSSRSLTK